MVELPQSFHARAAQRPDWGPWLAGLPRLLRDLLEEWQLTPAGEPLPDAAALVLPVLSVEGAVAVLKIGWPHEEAGHEHLALRAWDGSGAVRLWRADPRRGALLLEAADSSRDLNGVPVLDACAIAAGLYARLHRPALPQLHRLSQLCVEWSDRLAALPTNRLVPRRYVAQAASLARQLAHDPQTDGVLLHTDLHYANVLAASREPWLVIDPKPLSGDPAYEVAPLLWNRWSEVTAGASVRGAVRDRVAVVQEVAGLDEDRVRAWVVVREMVNVLTAYEDQARGIPLPAPWVTIATTIVKAVQP